MAAEWSQPRRLYVAAFSDGVVKIGITQATAKSRLTSLARWYGREPVLSFFGDRHECGFWGEQQLIDRLRRIANTHRGREWFTGVRFGEVKHLVEQISRRAVQGGGTSFRVHALSISPVNG